MINVYMYQATFITEHSLTTTKFKLGFLAWLRSFDNCMMILALSHG